MIKFVLFDLDGTLLPMDQDVFTKAYFCTLTQRVAKLGYEPKKLVDGVWAGMKSMVMNDGGCLNEEAFWKTFVEIFGEKAIKDKPEFDDYYCTDFGKVKQSCGFNPKAKETVDKAKKLGYRVILATNPIFPTIATENRIKWAGLKPADFELYTTYENTGYCKPNLKYYKDILERIDANPQECMMVGNDVGEDMIAEKLGMKVFLITDCMINKAGEDISKYPNGSFDELVDFLENNC